MYDFLNETRDKMLAKVNEAQGAAFKRYEQIKDQIKISIDGIKSQEDREEEIKRKVFANKFIFLIRVDKIHENSLDNRSPFKLYLVELDYYMDKYELLYFM